MRFGLKRKPEAELSCRPRSPKKSNKDIYTKMDSYYRQKAKSYPCARIIEIPPYPVRGVQGELNEAMRDQAIQATVRNARFPVEPALLTALKDSGIAIKTYINEYEVSKLLNYLGFRDWFGELVRESSQNRYSVWTRSEVYKSVCKWLDDTSGMVPSQRGKLLVSLESLINRSKNVISLEDRFLKDDRNTCYLPFINNVVKITKDGPSYLSHSEIPGWVWDHNVIEKDIKPLEELGGDWWKFLRRVCSDRGKNGPEEDSFEEQRFEALLCSIGYNIHRYKNPTQPAITIFSDQYNGKKNDGRTGKSIICNSIKHMKRKFIREDGRTINKDNRFNFAEIEASTDIVLIDDLNCKAFKLDSLYAKVTDDLTVEPKGKPKRTIPYAQAPKWLINSNDVSPIGTDGSDLGRRMDMQLKHYYSNTHQPTDDFGKEFWSDDWTDADWNQFYHAQMHAVQKSLEHNVAENGLPAYKNTIIEDSMRQEISEELIAIFEEKLKDRIEAGGEIRISNEKLNEWVPEMDLKVIKSKLVKYYQLKLEDRYDIEWVDPFKITGCSTTVRGVKLIPKQHALSIPVSPRRS